MKNHKKSIHNIKIQISRDDSCVGGFAAYLAPSLTKDGVAKVLLNIEATFHACIDHDIKPREFLLESIMHEVGHSVEEYLKLNFSEKRIEKVINDYRKKYGGTP